jgi:hypothetical protein
VDCLGPAGTRVKQLLACALQEVMDGSFGNAILEVRVRPSKGKLLLRVMTCLSEGIVVELPIVVLVVKDFHSMLNRVLLKCKLGGKCFCQQIIKLKVSKVETAEVVKKTVAHLWRFLVSLPFNCA